MKAILVSLVAAAALALAGGTSASSTKQIKLKLGDQLVVAGTSVFCQTQIGKTQLKGKKLVACYKIRKGAAIVGSYAPALAFDGELAVAKVSSKGAQIVFRRKPTRVHKTYTVNVGDTVVINDVDINGAGLSCAVGTSGGPYIACFLVTRRGGKAGSYSYAISDAAVAITQFTTPSKSKVVKTFVHPR